MAAGIIGNAYALVADAIESGADVFASIIVWSGLTIGGQPADDDHPFGHGKAEAMAAAVVSIMLIGAAFGIAFEAVREIRTTTRAPAPWTLGVLVAVIAIKWVLARRVRSRGSSDKQQRDRGRRSTSSVGRDHERRRVHRNLDRRRGTARRRWTAVGVGGRLGSALRVRRHRDQRLFACSSPQRTT